MHTKRTIALLPPHAWHREGVCLFLSFPPLLCSSAPSPFLSPTPTTHTHTHIINMSSVAAAADSTEKTRGGRGGARAAGRSSSGSGSSQAAGRRGGRAPRDSSSPDNNNNAADQKTGGRGGRGRDGRPPSDRVLKAQAQIANSPEQKALDKIDSSIASIRDSTVCRNTAPLLCSEYAHASSHHYCTKRPRSSCIAASHKRAMCTCSACLQSIIARVGSHTLSQHEQPTAMLSLRQSISLN
jgi:hypothetical protein